jgi:hypothetical protein
MSVFYINIWCISFLFLILTVPKIRVACTSLEVNTPATLFTREEDPYYRLTRRLGDPTDSLGAAKKGKIPDFFRGFNFGLLACSESLHWLSYPGSHGTRRQPWDIPTELIFCLLRNLFTSIPVKFKLAGRPGSNQIQSGNFHCLNQ